MNDRIMKMLLALVAVALWGILLRPAFIPAPAQAQAQIKQVEYGFESNSNLDRLRTQLNDAAKRGWHAKNVTIGGNGDYVLVLLER